jgi:hypothetical protein
MRPVLYIPYSFIPARETLHPKAKGVIKMRRLSFFFVLLFTVSPGMAGVVSDSLLRKIEVREIKLLFYTGDPDCRERFYQQFARTPYVGQFLDLSTEGWYATRIQYQKQIMLKAGEKGFDTASLSACFEKIKVKPMDEVAQIPVAAYTAVQNNEKIWVILCVWEYVERLNGKPIATGNIKGWAFSAKSRKQLCYMSSM